MKVSAGLAPLRLGDPGASENTTLLVGRFKQNASMSSEGVKPSSASVR